MGAGWASGLFQRPAFGSGKAKDLRLTCELNKAACYLKLQMFAEAKTACRIVLDEQGQNVKALFRRAQVWGEVRKCNCCGIL